MSNPVLSIAPDVPPLQIGMLIYPLMTFIDMAGPQSVLGMHGVTHLLWKTLDPVPTDSAVSVLPTATFAECPANLDVLFVPGGMGTNAMLQDVEVLAFLSEQGKTARYIASVCSASLILDAAGLLDGYKAAIHSASHETLDEPGVEAVHSCVVGLAEAA
ncbi:MAG: DJ-1/PfpI family protein [Bryobacteraceae bacterium]|nr:DJ-1/PfpI family protein [Bryobacteraceae bacterium]